MLKSKGKTNNKEQKKALAEAKLFTISRPYGYLPSEVNETIFKYNKVVEKQKELIFSLKDELSTVKEENAELEQEIRNLQFQLNFVHVDSVSEIQEDAIKDRFERNILGNVDESTEKKEKPKKKIGKMGMLSQARDDLKNSNGSVKEEEAEIKVDDGVIDFNNFL